MNFSAVVTPAELNYALHCLEKPFVPLSARQTIVRTLKLMGNLDKLSRDLERKLDTLKYIKNDERKILRDLLYESEASSSQDNSITELCKQISLLAADSITPHFANFIQFGGRVFHPEIKECFRATDIIFIDIDSDKGYISLGGLLPYDQFSILFLEECNKRKLTGINLNVLEDVIKYRQTLRYHYMDDIIHC